MQFKRITADDAAFLAEIFSIPEYDLYFAENDTTLEDWKERISEYYLSSNSYIVSNGDEKVGWIMYSIEGDTCKVDIIVLLPEKRHMGYGKSIFSDLIAANPQIKAFNSMFSKGTNLHCLFTASSVLLSKARICSRLVKPKNLISICH